MSYIGQGLPADVFGAYTVDTFTGDGSATTFTLSAEPTNDSALIVVVDNVIQQPTTNFTVSGTTLTIVGTAILSGIVGYAIHTQGKIPVSTATALDLNGASDALILDADADTTISADTDDQIDIKIAGADDFQLTANTFTVASGSKITYGDGGTTSRLMFDLWLLSTSINTGGSYNAAITANLERSDESGTDSIVGTGMSESSGIFTFPSTGIYLVTANASFSKNGADSQYNSVRVEVTTDNSSYNVRAEGWDYVPDNASSYGHTVSSCLVDVTNTTNVKVRFNARTEANAYVYGYNTAVATHFQFQRIGDT